MYVCQLVCVESVVRYITSNLVRDRKQQNKHTNIISCELLLIIKLRNIVCCLGGVQGEQGGVLGLGDDERIVNIV